MNVSELPPIAPRHLDTPAARVGYESYVTGFHAGRTNLPLPANASPIYLEAWTAGTMQRRAAAGEVIATYCQGSQCLKCKKITHGLRLGCQCWPSGGVDLKRNANEGFVMDWGMLLISDCDAVKFMSRNALLAARDSGMTIVDSTTGKPLLILDV